MLNPINILGAIQTLRHPPINTILKYFKGVVRPGQMLCTSNKPGTFPYLTSIVVVLGRPGSGCTTFLKTLANLRNKYVFVSGTVHYDSIPPSDIEHQFRGDVQYCSEDDVHFPTLTVEQTLSFAAKTRIPHRQFEELREEYIKQMTDKLTSVLDLQHTRNTLVGDAVIRGISGGEKKRVSIAETWAMRSCICAWDKLRPSLPTPHLTTDEWREM